MGGKVWSREEERVFWRVLIPQSPDRACPGIEPTKSWDELVPVMQAQMGANARRKYTGLGLFEHCFQNIHKRPSPNAVKYVREHKESIERAKEEDEQDDDPELARSENKATESNSHNHSNELESVWDEYDEIDEDKENRPGIPTRQPLALIEHQYALPDSTSMATSDVQTVTSHHDARLANAAQTAPGAATQNSTSSGCSSLLRNSARGSSHRYNYRSSPYDASHQQRQNPIPSQQTRDVLTNPSASGERTHREVPSGYQTGQVRPQASPQNFNLRPQQQCHNSGRTLLHQPGGMFSYEVDFNSPSQPAYPSYNPSFTGWTAPHFESTRDTNIGYRPQQQPYNQRIPSYVQPKETNFYTPDGTARQQFSTHSSFNPVFEMNRSIQNQPLVSHGSPEPVFMPIAQMYVDSHENGARQKSDPRAINASHEASSAEEASDARGNAEYQRTLRAEPAASDNQYHWNHEGMGTAPFDAGRPGYTASCTQADSDPQRKETHHQQYFTLPDAASDADQQWRARLEAEFEPFDRAYSPSSGGPARSASAEFRE